MLLFLHTHLKNSGDWLIQSTLKDNIAALTDEELHPVFIRDNIAKHLGENEYRKIIVSALSVMQDVYPSFMPLNGNLDGIRCPIAPIGCTWQHRTGYPEQALSFRLNENTLAFFKRLNEMSGPIPCRDHQAQMVLGLNGVAASFVGDMGLYDRASIGKAMRRPTSIRSLVFTPPHGPFYLSQAVSVLDLLQALFPEAERYFSLQSRPTKAVDDVLEPLAAERGFKTIRPYEDPPSLNGYERHDLHVGYRLHGHIGFLRKRVPSVLLVEDARGEGFRTSFPTGCFSARRASVDPLLGATMPYEQWSRYVSADVVAVDIIRQFLMQ
jgi:hypothetical protein